MPAPAKSQGHMRIHAADSPCAAAVQLGQAGCGSWLPAVLYSSHHSQTGMLPALLSKRLEPSQSFQSGHVFACHVNRTSPLWLLMPVLQPKGQEGKDAVPAPADGALKPSISGDEEFTISLEEPRVMESNRDADEPAAVETPAQPAGLVSLRIIDIVQGTGS